MASRSLHDLRPCFGRAVESVIKACRERGVDLLVTCTYRSAEEQDAAYAQGRTHPGPIVTHAKGGESAHNFGLACDVVPVRHGKPVWDTADPAWRVYGEEVARAGLVWGGSWATLPDRPHCEARDWRTSPERL